MFCAAVKVQQGRSAGRVGAGASEQRCETWQGTSPRKTARGMDDPRPGRALGSAEQSNRGTPPRPAGEDRRRRAVGPGVGLRDWPPSTNRRVSSTRCEKILEPLRGSWASRKGRGYSAHRRTEAIASTRRCQCSAPIPRAVSSGSETQRRSSDLSTSRPRSEFWAGSRTSARRLRIRTLSRRQRERP